MTDPKRRLRKRAAELEHGLRKQTDRALVPLRRLRGRARRWRQRAVLAVVSAVSIVGAVAQAIGVFRDQGRRSARRRTMEVGRRERSARGVPSGAGVAPGASEVSPSGAPGPGELSASVQDLLGVDERTIRRVAEQQGGGMSTEEMLARYEGGLNPGGLHGRAMRERIASDEIRHVSDEPGDPKARRPGHGRHMPAHRRGS